MTGRRKLIIVGAVTFLAALTLNFPARTALNWFAPAEWQISGISGSIWNGRAMSGHMGGIDFSSANWSIKPLALLLGKVAADISVATSAGRIDSSVAAGIGGSVTFENLSGTLSLAAIHPALRASRVDGVVNLEMKKVIVENGTPVFALGTIDVRSLLAGGLCAFSLGDFRAFISTENGEIQGQVENVDAMIEIDGTMSLRPDGSYLFLGTIAATSRAPDSITRNLQYLGSADAQGRRQFRFEGAL